MVPIYDIESAALHYYIVIFSALYKSFQKIYITSSGSGKKSLNGIKMVSLGWPFISFTVLIRCVVVQSV